MIFNSVRFLYQILLPLLVLDILFRCLRLSLMRKLLLLIFSVYFYSFFGWQNVLVLLLISNLNFLFIQGLLKVKIKYKKYLLLGSIVINLSILVLFKYFLELMNSTVSGANITFHYMPAGLSFYLFFLILLLLDVYEGRIIALSYMDFLVSTVYFPKLISGPIAHIKEVLKGLEVGKETREELLNGLFLGGLLFAIGLAKKVVLAENLAGYTASGYEYIETWGGHLNPIHAWLISVGFVLQLYFDFSGYTDMAIGIALMQNIKLPINFDSPLKKRNLILFWQSWHITLTKFLTTYVFAAILRAFKKPTFALQLLAIMCTMFLVGVWHGGNANFAIFGMINGLGLVVNYFLKRQKIFLPRAVAWLFTFGFLCLALVFVKATDLKSALMMFESLGQLPGFLVLVVQQAIAPTLSGALPSLKTLPLGMRVSGLTCYGGISLIIVLFCENSKNILNNFETWSVKRRVIFLIGLFYAISILGKWDYASYIYFKF